ncbi:hypothetical protein [Streptomyces sp. S.PB5]|uniref:hypothetical protein n=1 Tax=Streptomyces sp. S.PB5 TaxID=3020844 RepID=UPI0025B03907|nr:hypothetical protein [Streptomyces sp. S.PB5]MDN3029408.1 hypothetical protein [Streptomyces sp. S.PB5]
MAHRQEDGLAGRLGLNGPTAAEVCLGWSDREGQGAGRGGARRTPFEDHKRVVVFVAEAGWSTRTRIRGMGPQSR